MKKTEDLNILVLIYRLAAVLVCLVLLTTHLVAGLYARYTTQKSTSDYARVAKFDVFGAGTLSDSIEVYLIPSSSGTLVASVEVNSDCEVAVNCSVKVTNVTKNVPFEFALMRDGVEVTDMSFDYYPGSSSSTYELMVSLPEDTELPDSNLEYRGMVDYITVTVEAVQID